MSDDELSELRRQQALIRQHLIWLDRQIEALQRGKPSLASDETINALPLPPSPNASRIENLDTSSLRSTSPSDLSEQIMARYRASSSDLQRDTKRGCLIAFVVGMTTLLGATLFFYLVWQRHHDAISPPKPTIKATSISR